jgi:hypothetical protein
LQRTASNINHILLFEVTRTVFSSWVYVSIAVTITAIFWVLFSFFDQLLFFSPVLTFYLPKDAVVDFVLSSITAGLLGMVVSMNIYALRQQYRHSTSMNSQKKNKKIGSATASSCSLLFSGSSLGVLSTLCVNCSSSLGFVLLSIFGSGLGIALSTFLSNYQMPLRIVSVVILLWSYYSISKNVLTKHCPISSNNINLKNNTSC